MKKTAETAKSFALLSLLTGAVIFTSGVGAVERIYHNGRIITVNPYFEIVEALAVERGKIVQAGPFKEVERLASPDTVYTNLQGRTVLPGFYDAHVHLRIGPGPQDHDWSSFHHPEKLESRIREAAENAPAGHWIRGILGFNWSEEELPDRRKLDALAPDNPVVITVGAHLMLVNSNALKLAGINAATPDPPGGRIVRDRDGEPAGRLQEVASWHPVLELVPWSIPDDAVALARIRAQLKSLLAAGITSANVAGVRPHDRYNPYRHLDMPAMRWIQQVYRNEEDGLPRLTVQVRLYPGYEKHTDPVREGAETAIRDLESMGFHTGFGDDRLKLGAVKLSLDGGDAGWTLEPYANRPGFTGIVRIPKPVLYQVVRRAKELGWQVGIHTVGDAAVVHTVDMLERIYRELDLPIQRDYLHHVSVLPPAATLRKMAALNIAVNSQPNFISFKPLRDSLDGHRLAHNSPQRSLLVAGIRVGYGSDSVPYDPLFGIWSAVTRQGSDGRIYGGEEAISLEQAIRNYTLGSAYLTGDETRRGSLEPGKEADMVILDRDILAVPPQSIRDIRVLTTIIGGEVVYTRPVDPDR